MDCKGTVAYSDASHGFLVCRLVSVRLHQSQADNRRNYQTRIRRLGLLGMDYIQFHGSGPQMEL